MSTQTSIIIIAANGKDVTKACLDSLRGTRFLEVIVVDNASTDGTALMLAQYSGYPILVIRNRKNRGYAEANNQGYRKSKGKYVCFLNNDTIVTKNFLLPLEERLGKMQSVAAVQPTILFPDGTIDSVGSFFTPTGFLYHKAHRQLPSKGATNHREVYTLKGACMVWKRSVLEKIGLFDTSYFAYFEETELCHRAHNAGYTVEYVRNATITHLGGFTSNRMDPVNVQSKNLRNRLTTYLRHLSLQDLLRVYVFHVLLSEALVIRTLLQSVRMGFSLQRALIVGIHDGIRTRTTTHKRTRLPERKPDLGYYRALFSALEDYTRLY